MLKISRYILLVVLLLSGALQALAQMSLPDKLCLGTSRKYWVFGLPGSIYTWKLDGAIQGSTADSLSLTWSAAGVYQLEVQEHQDNCTGDIQSIAVTVYALPAAPAAVVSVQPNCMVPSGTILVSSPAEGTGYSYSIDGGLSWKSTSTFSGVLPDTIRVMVRETANGCVSPATTLVVKPVPLAPAAPVVVMTKQPTCISPAGTLVVTSPAKDTGFRYSLDGGKSWVSTVTFSGLSPGSYTFTVQDTLTKCISPGTLVLLNISQAIPDVPVATVSHQPSCMQSTGTILISSPAEGTGYFYSIDGGKAWSTNVIFSGLAPGNYPVQVQESATGCISLPLVLTVDPVPLIPVAMLASVTKQPSCPSPRGTIVVAVPSEGTGYTYSIDGGISWDTKSTFDGLFPGSYPVVARETATGCKSPVQLLHVDSLPDFPIVLKASVTQQPDCNFASGTIVVSSPPEGSGFKYSIDDGLNWVSTAQFSGLGHGSYPVAIQETATGCKSPSSLLQIFPVPPAPTASVTIHPTCLVPTGTIVVTVPEERNGFVYSIDNGAHWVTTATITGVPVGPVSLIIKDIVTGCDSPPTVLEVNPVPAPPPAPVVSVVHQPDCPVPFGSIEFNTPAGGSGFVYSIDGGLNWSSKARFDGLKGGTYLVSVQETATACTSPAVSLVVLPAPVSGVAVSVSVSHQPDCPVPTGTIVFTAPAQGTGFTYSIDGGANWLPTATFPGVLPGTYNVHVRDAISLCQAAETVLTVNMAPSAALAAVTQQPGCIVPAGTIVFSSPLAGSGSDYSIDNGVSWHANPVFSGLSPGSYSVKSREIATGCLSSGPVLLVNPLPAPPAAPVILITRQSTCVSPSGDLVITSPAEGVGFLYSFNSGTNWFPSATFKGLVPGNYPMTVKEIASGCISGVTVASISLPPSGPTGLIAKVSKQPDCPSPAGTVEVSYPAEGTGYMYSINGGLNWVTTATFTGLKPGTYNVSVRETATGCTSLTPDLIVNPLPAIPAAPVAMVLAHPDCKIPTGTIEVSNPKEGTGFEYSIDNGLSWHTSATFTGLKSGDYAVIVQDAVTKCRSLATLLNVHPYPEAPTASVTVQPTCPVPTGTITVTIPAANSGFMYSINGGLNWLISPVLTGVPSGPVSVTIKDILTGCESPPTVLTVNPVPASPAAPLVSATKHPDCLGPTGTFVVTSPAEGTGFTYSNDGGTNWVGSATFSGLASGDYTVVVKETATNCISPGTSVKINAMVLPPAVPVASITVQPDCDVSTGTLVVSLPAEGTGFLYSIDAGLSWLAKATFTGLAPGIHKVIVKEITTACSSAPATVTVNAAILPPVAPAASITVQPNCLVPAGTLVITSPKQGTGFIYSVDGGVSWDSKTTYTGLLSAKYNVLVQETATGCKSPVLSLTVNPITPAPPAPTATVGVQPNCNLSTGTILVSLPVQGTGYTYSIDNGKTWAGTSVFNGLPSGIYQVKVRSAVTGCESPATTLTVNPAPVVPPAPVAGVTVQPGCTVPTGTIVISKPAVSTGFTYSMNGGPYQASPVFSGLSPGIYQLKVKDLVFGCESPVSSLTVKTVPPPPSAPIAGITAQPNCIIPTGTITVSVPGAGKGYEYRINAGSYQPTATFSLLNPGIHRVQVRDLVSGCESPESQLTVNAVPVPPAAPLVQVSLHPTCDNPNGTVKVVSPKENTGFEYSIDGKGYQQSATFTGLKWGEHTLLTRQISTGCVSPPTKVMVNAIPPTPVVILASTTDCLCFNGLGSISLQLTNVPNGIYTIGYNGGQFRNVRVTAGRAIIPAAARTYTNLVISANGCLSVSGVNVTVLQPPPIQIIESITEIDLKSNRKGAIKLALNGGNGPYAFKWSTGATSRDISNLPDGSYTVVVTDAKGCTAVKTVIIPIPDRQPVAVNDAYDASCYGVEGFLTDNDYDPDGDLFFLDAQLFKNPLHGTVTLNPATGHFRYMPGVGFSGLEQFEYAIYDVKHYLGDTAKVTITVLADFDCDAVPDDVDVDADNDGILMVDEGDEDTDSDGDGIPNDLDIDSDNDGITDNIEAQSLANYIALLNTDSDKDGLDDAYDADSGGTVVLPVDTDKDGIPDFLDVDSDNDLVPDYIEGHDSNSDGKPDHILSGKDSDSDGLDDAFDTIDRLTSQAANVVGSNASMQDFEGDGASDWRDDNDDDDEYLTRFEDLNMDGNYSNDDIDFDGHPEYLDYGRECDLFIPEAFSPNNDNVHDYFQIYCIDHFPNAKMIIFDQFGNKVYEKANYGNLDQWGVAGQAWWDATTENRLVAMKGGKVPPGTYFYVLQLGNGDVKKGYVFVSY